MLHDSCSEPSVSTRLPRAQHETDTVNILRLLLSTGSRTTVHVYGVSHGRSPAKWLPGSRYPDPRDPADAFLTRKSCSSLARVDRSLAQNLRLTSGNVCRQSIEYSVKQGESDLYCRGLTTSVAQRCCRYRCRSDIRLEELWSTLRSSSRLVSTRSSSIQAWTSKELKATL